MDQEQSGLQYTKIIDAPVSQVFQSFTNAASIVEWLCDDAKLLKKKGGRTPEKFYFWWMDGYHAFGEFTHYTKNKAVHFTWLGSIEPHSTNVKVDLTETSEGVKVALAHSGLGEGEEWENTCKEFDKGWTTGLENLKQMLETGMDLRYYKQPMMGVYVGDIINEELAAEENLAVKSGIRITGVVAKMGAEKLDLKEKDILYQLDGKYLQDYNDIFTVASNYQARDVVPLVYYRGSEKFEVELEFTGKPEPEYKPTALGFSEQMKKYFSKVNEKLERALEGVTDEEADFIPSAGEWSVKEVLAHLIAEERFSYSWAVAWVMRNLNYSYPATNLNYLKTIVCSYPTIPALMQELKRIQKEKIIYFAELPQEFVDRKHSYIKLASHAPEELLHHTKDHLKQLSELISAARGG